MKILAIDTSTNTASVSVIDDTKVISEITSDYKLQHSQTILNMVKNALEMSEDKVCDMDAIAVAIGPGSFTGLRIGLAVAKGLAFSDDIPVIGIDTLESIACNYSHTNKNVCVLLDARRDYVYTGIYSFDNNQINTELKSSVLLIDELIEVVNNSGRDTIFVGDGAGVFKDKISKQSKINFFFAEVNKSRNKACNIAKLALEKLKSGEVSNTSEIKINYIRPTQAQRQREEKLNAN